MKNDHWAMKAPRLMAKWVSLMTHRTHWWPVSLIRRRPRRSLMSSVISLRNMDRIAAEFRGSIWFLIQICRSLIQQQAILASRYMCNNYDRACIMYMYKNKTDFTWIFRYGLGNLCVLNCICYITNFMYETCQSKLNNRRSFCAAVLF